MNAADTSPKQKSNRSHRATEHARARRPFFFGKLLDFWSSEGKIGEFSVLVKGRKAAPQAPPGAARRRAAPPEAVLGRGA